MKIKKRTSAFCVAMMLFTGVISIQAFAETKVQDGVEVNFNSEKEEYEENEHILTKVTIKNTNSDKVSNISIEGIIPENYKIAANSNIEKNIAVLYPGEAVSLQFEYEPESLQVINQPIRESIDSTETLDNIEKTDNIEKAESIDKEYNTEVKNEGNIIKVDNKESNDEKETIAGEKTIVKESKPNKDNIGYKIVLSLFIIVGGVVIVYIIVRKKAGKKIIPFMVLIPFIAFGNAELNYAKEANTTCISTATTVKVNNLKVTLKINVKYQVEADKKESTELKKPNNPTETDNYFWSNSKVISVIDASKSKELYSEKQVISLLKGRGFDNYPITYDSYSTSGEYVDSLEITEKSNQKHPMYETIYISENGVVWNIYVINGSVFANPASVNAEAEIEAQVLYSEAETLTSYAVEGNKFYVTIPYESFIILKQVEKIDAARLDKIEYEEIIGNEK